MTPSTAGQLAGLAAFALVVLIAAALLERRKVRRRRRRLELRADQSRYLARRAQLDAPRDSHTTVTIRQEPRP